MGRRATGQVRELVGADGATYRSLRFRAYGERRFISLGTVPRDEAERTLRGILADVERGIWQPDDPAPAPEPLPGAQTFHEFAELWWIEHESDWRPNTIADYRWRLESHLLPFFKGHRLDEITIAEVDRYKALKRKRDDDGKQLSARTVNMTLVLLSAILEVAEERELITRNPARGKRRRVRRDRSTRTYLDTAEQILALLAAGRELDAGAHRGRQHVARHALLAVLTFAGLRIQELLDLRWRDVDLANGRLHVGDAKTEAGQREVTIRPALRAVLVWLKADRRPRPAAYVFATATGRRMSESNVRNRILSPAVARANEHAQEDGSAAPELPKLTPHSLRRTFASLLYAIGESPPVVMAEMGHTDPALALAIYAKAMRRGPTERAKLEAVVAGEPLPSAQNAQTGTKDQQSTGTEGMPESAAKAA